MTFGVSKKPGMIPGFFFFLFCLALAWKLTSSRTADNHFANVCHFVEDHIYLSKDKLQNWKKDCLTKARDLPSGSSVQDIIDTFNQSFSLLRTSHLSLYAPAEARKLWEGQSEETGIESHYVGGELVIAKVHAQSPAAKAQLKPGDIIARINGYLGNPAQAESEEADFEIRWHQKTHTVHLKPAAFQRDEAVEVQKLSARTAVLKVPSLRAEFFEKEKWLATIRSLKGYPEIILDLRGNLGGNFVAGLRLLSPFLCEPTEVGALIKTKSTSTTVNALKDDLNDEAQIETVDRSQKVLLKTFAGYGCLSQLNNEKLTVLVDSGSASTSEMVAQALKELKGAQLLGSQTAGQLLVGVWYAMPELGAGVKISIPEAQYVSVKGHTLEGPGVQLDEVLYYHLEELQNGEDSWLKTVSKRNVSN